MRDDDDGGARGRVQVVEQRENLLPGARVEIARGLVGEEDRRVDREGARDRDPLPLAARELDGIACVERAVPEAHERHRIRRRRLGVRRREEPRDELHVAAHRPVRHEPAFLHHVSDAAPERDRLGRRDVDVVHADRARVRRDEPIEAAQKRRLPGPTLAHERNTLAAGNVDRHPVQCADRARTCGVALDDVAR